RVLIKALNAVFTASNRGQDITEVNALFEHKTKEQEYSDDLFVAHSSALYASQVITSFGFRSKPYERILTDNKGKKIISTDGRVIKEVYITISEISQASIDTNRSVRSRWREELDLLPPELKKVSKKKKVVDPTK
ncbi:MAG: hypothetical protein WAW92_00420, partial [Minisyncoccia bacterium]